MSLITASLAREPDNEQNRSVLVDTFRKKIAALDPPQGHEGVHFCVAPADSSDNLYWALASLHQGHAVILADHWDPHQLLRQIQRYQVITVYLDGNQARDLLSLESSERNAYDLSSLRHVVLDLQDASPGLHSELMTWFGLPLPG